MAKGIVFDFNGTLIDDLAAQKEAWSLFDRRYEITEKDRKKLKKRHDGVCNVNALALLFPEKSREELMNLSREKEAIYREILLRDEIELRKGVLDLFQKLKEKNIPFTIASASIRENIDFFVRQYGLDRYINPDLIVYDTGQYRDKKEMYLDAARILGLNPADLLVIEDSRNGFLGAEKAKAGKILFFSHPDNQSFQKERDHQNLYIFEDWNLLPIERFLERF